MTPDVVLDLTLDGISVLTRAPADHADAGAWWREGTVRMDAPDLPGALARLRQRAAARVGEDFTSILILPDSQILYTSLERDDRRAVDTIRASLKGRTPYDVEDLKFDHVARGDRLQVAVVALETLLEAETFAADYGFRPLAVIADPDRGVYPGLPNLGATGIARELTGGAPVDLGLGDSLHRRPAPPLPRPEPEEVAAPVPEEVVPQEVVSEEVVPDEGVSEDVAAIPDEEPVSDVDAVEEAPEPIADPDPVAEPATDIEAVVVAMSSPPPAPDTPAPDPAPEVEAPPVDSAPEEAEAAAPVFIRTPRAPAAEAPKDAGPSFTSRRRSRLVDSTDGRIQPSMTRTPAPPPRAPADPTPAKPAPEPPALAAVPTPAAPEPVTPKPSTPVPAAVTPLVTKPVTAKPMAAKAPTAEAQTPPAKAPTVDADDVGGMALPGLAREEAARPRKRGLGARALAAIGLLGILLLVGLGALAFFGGGEDEQLAIATPPDTPVIPQPVRPAPDAAAVEVPPAVDLASLLPESGGAAETAPEQEPDTPVILAPVADAPLPDDAQLETFDTSGAGDPPPAQPLAPQVDGSTIQLSGVDPSVAGAPAAELAPPTPPSADVAPQTTPRPAEPQAPADTATVPEADTAPEPDATAEPAVTPEPTPPTATDTAEAETPPTPPAPAQPVLASSAPGFVAATRGGTLAPGGYSVVLGRPSVVPLQRPGGDDAVLENVALSADSPLIQGEAETDAPDAVPEPPALTPEQIAAREILSRTRPIARPTEADALPEAVSDIPTDEVPEITPEAAADAVPDTDIAPDEPIGDPALRSTLPQPRPASIAQGAEEAARIAAAEAAAEAAAQRARDEADAAQAAQIEAAVAAAQQAAAASLASGASGQRVAAVTQSTGPTSALALAQSDRPGARPRSVEREAARIVTRRREQTAAPTQTAAARQQVPNTGNQTIRSAGGSASRAATEQNVLRLNQINLIGVYGRPSARRALVRLGNGRYVKVEVGDRLDRGRVTSIGDGQLTYQRGGRQVALRLPQG